MPLTRIVAWPAALGSIHQAASDPRCLASQVGAQLRRAFKLAKYAANSGKISFIIDE